MVATYCDAAAVLLAVCAHALFSVCGATLLSIYLCVARDSMVQAYIWFAVHGNRGGSNGEGLLRSQRLRDQSQVRSPPRLLRFQMPFGYG